MARGTTTGGRGRARALALALAGLVAGVAPRGSAQGVASAPPLPPAAASSAGMPRVTEAVAVAVASLTGLSREEIAVPALLDLEASAADPQVVVHVLPAALKDGASTLPVTVSLVRAGQEIARSTATVRLRPLRSVLVAVRPLARGALLRAEDVREEMRADAPVDAALPADGLQALALTRSVSAGSVLREGWLAPPTTVERGQSVRLRALRAGLAVEAAGRALEAGRTGETIRVMNVGSRRVLAGRVAPDGAVDMDF